jgi:MFS transporter, SHS family, sialic acid transporter
MPPPKNSSSRIQRTHLIVLLAAFLGWLFDGFEMGLFPIVARPALTDMYQGTENVEIFVGQWMGWITAVFLLGAAAGGFIFGWLGDRVGRVKAMSFSILTYSVFTGLGFFAQEPWHLAVFRFLAALGMGGEWSLGVALVMECWPERLRPLMAGIIGAAANFGFLLVAAVSKAKEVTVDSWRWMWLVGVVPAILVFFIRLFVPESERWKASVSKETDHHPLKEVFSKSLIKHTCLAICFSSVALIGTWGSVQWIPVWVDQMVGETLPTAKSDVGMLSAMGAIIGCLAGPLIGGSIGRRPAFFTLCLSSLLVCGVLFRSGIEYGATFKCLVFLAGMTTAAFYGWFPLYLPELFPTRSRATGQGVGYNSGRIFAAFGAIAGGQLVAAFDGDYARMGSVISLIYLVGMVVIWVAPETKGKPLPD